MGNRPSQQTCSGSGNCEDAGWDLGPMPIQVTDLPKFFQLLWECNHLRLRQGILYSKALCKWSQEALFQLVLPAAHRETTLEGCHNESGHLGFKRMLDLLCDCFFWAQMAVQGKELVKKCCQCIAFKAKQQKALMESITATHPLELVEINYLCLEPGKGKENILVVTDHFTWYAQTYIAWLKTVQTMAKVLWDNFIVLYRLPGKILSDQQRNFESELIAYLCRLTGTKKLRTNLYHPQTNCQSERLNSTLINMLGMLPPECKSDWKGSIRMLVHMYNCICSSTIGFSPYLLMYGRQPQLPIDVTLGITPKLITMPTSSKYIQKLRDYMK